MNNKQAGIELVRATYGDEVAANMQQNQEDIEVLEQIGLIAARLGFLSSCTLAYDGDRLVLMSTNGKGYGPRDMTPVGLIARDLVRDNYNSINMAMPDCRTGRSAFADRFCRS